MPEDTGPLPGGPTVADRWLATVMYLKTPTFSSKLLGLLCLVLL
jgi:hypothetical protein